MTVTEVRFSGIPRDPFLTYASVILDDVVAIKSIAVLRRTDGRPGIMLAMPQRGVMRTDPKTGAKVEIAKVDVVHPIQPSFRAALEREVYKAYREQIGEVPGA